MANNFHIISTSKHPPVVRWWELAGIIQSVGQSSFIYETGHCLIPIRRTMLKPHQLPKVLTITFICITAYLLVLGSSFLLAYGKYVTPESTFDYYIGEHNLFSTFVYFYGFTCFLTFLFDVTCIEEAIVDTPLRC